MEDHLLRDTVFDMTNEEFEKTKKFILEQHAQFAAGMKQLRQSQANTERVVAKAERAVAQAGNTVAQLANGTREDFKNVRGKINTKSILRFEQRVIGES